VNASNTQELCTPGAETRGQPKSPGKSVASLLNQAMRELAAQPNALFIGQGVEYPGVATYRDLEGIPMEQRLEWPVAENLQLGACIGLSLQGYLPISIFPRCDFLLLALDQLVNHLEKLEEMSRGQYKPKVIVRTKVGSKWPLDAGPQHTNDHAEAFRLMLTNVSVVQIASKDDIIPAYRQALESPRSSLVIEAL